MKTSSLKYHELFIKEIGRRIFDECQPRVYRCLDLLSTEEIWYRPNEHSNSVGNLVLHLCGNIHQWILATMGGQQDSRERQQEFDHRNPLAATALKNRLEEVLAETRACLEQLTPEALVKSYQVQGFVETGIGILIHVTEHFSYHVGQITYFVKAHQDIDIGYYQGKDLNARTR